MKRYAISFFLVTALAAAQPNPLAGFNPDSAAKQRDLEVRFDKALNRQNLQQWMKRMTAKPHHVGSPGSKEVAEFIATQFKSWGYETRIDTYYPLFPTPKTRIVELLSPTPYKSSMRRGGHTPGDENASDASR